jgi:hypothetical protein
VSAAASGDVARVAAIALLWPIRALALEICWEANESPLAQARPGMNVTAMLMATNEGELLGEPRFADVWLEASLDREDAVRAGRGRGDRFRARRCRSRRRSATADGIAENHAVH